MIFREDRNANSRIGEYDTEQGLHSSRLIRSLSVVNGAFWGGARRMLVAKLLNLLVGAWGFEPQTPTVSR